MHVWLINLMYTVVLSDFHIVYDFDIIISSELISVAFEILIWLLSRDRWP